MVVPGLRCISINDERVDAGGQYVLYWMISARRTRYSFGLQYAVERARALGRPLVVLEPLRVGYRWASVRHHTFVIQGMRDQASAFAEAGVRYLPWVESQPGDGKGLLEALAARACEVVTDHFPAFFLPRMVAAAGKRLSVRLTAIDGLGIYPLKHAERIFTTAASFRRHLHKTILPHLSHRPEAEPLLAYDGGMADLPAEVSSRWPASDLQGLLAGGLAELPIDQHVPPVAGLTGGQTAGLRVMEDFLAHRLQGYADSRNDVMDSAASGLSPWLHFGHVGAHELVWRVLDGAGWTPAKVAPKPTGKRNGWWGLPPAEEAFLDECITWRELGHVFCDQRPDDYDTLGSLPSWALTTIAEHANDPRPVTYDLAELDAARTHDDIWNAAQRQLKAEGRIHNYLRMLWGKKIYEWAPSAEVALAHLIELNNRYALDGRDPNSYSGIFWTLGRFDRAWGPVRPVFGKLRFMSSDSTRRKLKLNPYLERWGPGPE